MCLAEPLQDLLALRYCLCSIARCMALQFADVDGSPFSLHLRRLLFLAFSTWTEEGAIPGQPAWRYYLFLDCSNPGPNLCMPAWLLI